MSQIGGSSFSSQVYYALDTTKSTPPNWLSMRQVKQRDILTQLGRGKSYAEIGIMFDLAKPALYNHLKRIRRMGVEPSDPNSCRQKLLPGCKIIPVETKRPDVLTPKHIRILRHIAAGLTTEQIQASMGIGHQTIRNGACEAFKRLGIPRRNAPESVWRPKLQNFLACLPDAPTPPEKPQHSTNADDY